MRIGCENRLIEMTYRERDGVLLDRSDGIREGAEGKYEVEGESEAGHNLNRIESVFESCSVLWGVGIGSSDQLLLFHGCIDAHYTICHSLIEP